MICRVCPVCGKDSYSAYDDPNWICPYCSARMGKEEENKSKKNKE